MSTINNISFAIPRNTTASNLTIAASTLGLLRISNASTASPSLGVKMPKVRQTPAKSSGGKNIDWLASSASSNQTIHANPNKATTRNGSPRGGAGKTQSRQQQRKAAEGQLQKNATTTTKTTPNTKTTPKNSNSTAPATANSVTSKKIALKPFTPKPAGTSWRNDTDVGKGHNTTTTTTELPIKAFEPHVRSKRAFGAIMEHDVNNKFRTYQAVTLYRNSTEYCSGSILGDDLILTAAHCVVDKELDSITVGLGSTVKAEQFMVKVESIETHPDYARQTLNTITEEELEALYGGDEEDYGDYEEDPEEFVTESTNDGGLSKYDVAVVSLEKGGMAKAAAENIQLEYIKIENPRIIRVFERIKRTCKGGKVDPVQLRRMQQERFWLMGSGKATHLNTTNFYIEDEGNIIKTRADTTFLPANMLSGYLQLHPDCKNLKNTLSFVFNISSADHQDKIAWCSGDSGSTIYHVPRGGAGYAKPIALVRGSDTISGDCVHSYLWRENDPRYMIGRMDATPLDKSVRHFIHNSTKGKMKHNVAVKFRGNIPDPEDYPTEHVDPAFHDSKKKKP